MTDERNASTLFPPSGQNDQPEDDYVVYQEDENPEQSAHINVPEDNYSISKDESNDLQSGIVNQNQNLDLEVK